MDSASRPFVNNIISSPMNEAWAKAKILNHIEIRKYLGVSYHEDIDRCNVAIGTILELKRCRWMVVSQ